MNVRLVTLFMFLLVQFVAFSQSKNCLIDGLTSGWEFSHGTYTELGGAPVYNFPISGTTRNFHLIMNKNNGNDPKINQEPIPVVPNGSLNSMRIGNFGVNGVNETSGGTYQKAKKIFVVEKGFSIFKFEFAAILEDDSKGHADYQKPGMSFFLKDAGGATIPCSKYNIRITPGQVNSNFKKQGLLEYRNWTTVVVDLKTYENQAVTFEIEAHGCTRTGHFGYVYFNAVCQKSEFKPYVECPTTLDNLTLEAPIGFPNYVWSTGDTSRTITVNARLGDKYEVTAIPINQVNANCNTKIVYDIKKLEFIKEEILTACEGSSVTFKGNQYNQTSTQYFRKPLSILCDSIYVAHVKIIPFGRRTVNKTICAGETFFFKNNNFTTANSYMITQNNNNACDSIITLNLKTVVQPITNPTYNFCLGGSVKIGNQTFNKTGLYTINIPRPNICDSIVNAKVIVENDFKLKADQFHRINKGASVNLFVNALPADNYVYDWSPKQYLSCYNCPNPKVTPMNNVSYTVKVSKQGSSCFKDINLQIFNNCGVFVADVFSPNDDRINDFFKINASPCVKTINELIVFNRWGQTVFKKNNFIPGEPGSEWDGTFNGKKLEPDTFGYKIIAELLNGESINYQGAVLLAR